MGQGAWWVGRGAARQPGAPVVGQPDVTVQGECLGEHCALPGSGCEVQSLE